GGAEQAEPDRHRGLERGVVLVLELRRDRGARGVDVLAVERGVARPDAQPERAVRAVGEVRRLRERLREERAEPLVERGVAGGVAVARAELGERHQRELARRDVALALARLDEAV